MKLRPYQEKALGDLDRWFENNPSGNPIINMCVGAGKSVIIAQICKDFIEKHPTTRIIMAVASRILVQQNVERLRAVWPEAPIGICSGNLGKDMRSQIVFGTIDTLAKYADQLGRVDILLIDECHNVNPKNEGRYRSFIEQLKYYGSKWICAIGLTGTPFRGDGAWLTSGEDALFTSIAATVSMDDLLESKHLSPLVVPNDTPEITGDLSQVKLVNQADGSKDYKVGDLGRAMSEDAVIDATVKDLIVRGADRKKWLVFCVTIEHAEKVCSSLSRHVPCEIITGDTNAETRNALIKRYRSGEIRALVNVNVLTTGFDVPEIDLIALLRPTKSYVLYVQIAGRGMRIADGKTDCLWLDYTSTTREKGAVNKIRGREVFKKTAGEVPFKLCPECGSQNPVGAKECTSCGAELPMNDEAKEYRGADDAEIIASFKPPEKKWHKVKKVTYASHLSRKNPSSPPSFRARYHLDTGSFFADETIDDYWFVQSVGYSAREVAIKWQLAWDEKYGECIVPRTTRQAIEQSLGLKIPHRIATIPDPKNPKYKKVVDYEF